MYYKILQPCADGKYWSAYGGRHTWVPGITYGPVPVEPCSSGFHACRLRDLGDWVEPGMVVFEVELTDVVETRDKVVGSTAKLGRRLGTITMDAYMLAVMDRPARGAADASYLEAEGRLILSRLVTP